MNEQVSELVEMLYRLLNVPGFGPSKAHSFLRTLLEIESREDITLRELEEAILRHLNSAEQAAFHHLLLPNLGGLKSVHPYNYATILDHYFDFQTEQYPTCFGSDLGSPTVLSYMGNWELLHRQRVGFSGLRKVSSRGVEHTICCAKKLVERDVCIVSGYANGVDEAAHLTALKEGGTTIMILPYGLTYFTIKPTLEAYWDWNRVLVISEFIPTHPFSKHNAMQRNETIIRTSDALILPEVGETGGSQSAGQRSVAMKRPTFTIKETINPSLGNEVLLRKGASALKTLSSGEVDLSAVFAEIDGVGRLF